MEIMARDIERVPRGNLRVPLVDFARVWLRWTGHRLRAETGIVVDPALDVVAGHDIAVEVHHALLHGVPKLVDATVHVSPRADEGRDPHELLAHHKVPAGSTAA